MSTGRRSRRPSDLQSEGPDRIEVVFRGKEREILLPRPLPIHIEYFTDFVDEFGEMKERPDVYMLIRKVEAILAWTSQD